MRKNLFEVLKEKKQIIKMSIVALFGATAMYMAPACFATVHTDSADEQDKVGTDVVSTDSANRERSTHEPPVVQAASSNVDSSATDSRASLENLAKSDLKLDTADDISAVSYDETERILRINKSGRYAVSCPKNQTNNRIEVTADEGEVHLTLSGVRIVTDRLNAAALNIVGNCNVAIEVRGKNKLDSGENCAGLQKDGKGKLTIQGNGQLVVFGGKYGAGIGGGADKNGEQIIIKEATICAVGGKYGAGIGGGCNGSGKNITVESGKILAQGGYLAAGIGGGKQGDGKTITISAETARAFGGEQLNKSKEYMPGIGGGFKATNILDSLNMDYIIRSEPISESEANGTLVCNPTDCVYDFSDHDIFTESDKLIDMRPFEGKVFSHIPNLCDVYQRVTGDCTFSSILMSFAKNNPQSIINSIISDGKTVTVRLYDYARSRKPYFYKMKNTIPINCENTWAALFEKAYVLHIMICGCLDYLPDFSSSPEELTHILKRGPMPYDVDGIKNGDSVFKSLTNKPIEQVPQEELSNDAISHGFSLITTQDDCQLPSLSPCHCFAILEAGVIPNTNISYAVVRDPHGVSVPLYEQVCGRYVLSPLNRMGANGIFILLSAETCKYFDCLTVKRYKK